MNLIDSLWHLVVVNSGRATLLIACVFVVRWVFKGRIPARFFPWLWLLVAFRLLLPVAPSSSTSVYNLFSGTSGASEQKPEWVIRKGPAFSNAPMPTPRDATPLVAAPVPTSSGRVPLLALVWLGGVCVQVALLGWSANRMRRSLRDATPVSDPRLIALVRQCAETLGLRRKVAIFETVAVGGPAIVGLWRPRLLLPRGLTKELSEEEIYFVLLHECAHLRRHDLVAVWLLLAVRIVHWFNPFVWLAARTARIDAEFACDETVLRHSEEDAPSTYGAALLRLAQLVTWQRSMHPAAGILQRRTALHARIATISRYSPPAAWRMVAAIVLILGVTVVFAADEKSASAAGSITPKDTTAEHEPKSVDVNRTSENGLPDWAKGLSVIRLTLPKFESSGPAEVEVRNSEGRTFIPNIGKPLDEDPWLENLTVEEDGARWKLTLRKNAERAELMIPAEVVSRRGDDSGRVQVEIKSRFIETTDTAILRLQSHASGVELLRSAVRRGPEEQVISATQAIELLYGGFDELRGRKDSLDAPSVITRSGQRAVIEMIREVRYPTKWKSDAENKIWVPESFETRNTGVTIEVEPFVGENGRVRMHLIAQVVRLLGSRDAASGEGFPVSPPLSRGLAPFEAPGIKFMDPGMGEGGLQPVFSARKRETTITLSPDESLLFASLPETEDVRPFKSPAESRRLIAVISARLVDRRGNKIAAVASPPASSSGPALADAGVPAAVPPPGSPGLGVIVPGKPGFVSSPYAPDAGYVDVRGFPPGAKVKCPYSGRFFLVP